MAGRAMKARLVAKITIAAGRPEVFRYLTHLKYHYLWNPHLQSIAPLTTLKLGTAYNTASLLLGVRVQGTNVVTQLLPGKELRLENSTGTLHYSVSYRLSEDGDATVLTCTTSVSSDSTAFAFTKPVLKLLGRRELQSDLQALKIAVEQHLESL